MTIELSGKYVSLYCVLFLLNFALGPFIYLCCSNILTALVKLSDFFVCGKLSALSFSCYKVLPPVFFFELAYSHCGPHGNFLSLQELRMYNPKYLERPYIVVLNKIDLPEVCSFPSL